MALGRAAPQGDKHLTHWHKVHVICLAAWCTHTSLGMAQLASAGLMLPGVRGMLRMTEEDLLEVEGPFAESSPAPQHPRAPCPACRCCCRWPGSCWQVPHTPARQALLKLAIRLNVAVLAASLEAAALVYRGCCAMQACSMFRPCSCRHDRGCLIWSSTSAPLWQELIPSPDQLTLKNETAG